MDRFPGPIHVGGRAVHYVNAALPTNPDGSLVAPLATCVCVGCSAGHAELMQRAAADVRAGIAPEKAYAEKRLCEECRIERAEQSSAARAFREANTDRGEAELEIFRTKAIWASRKSYWGPSFEAAIEGVIAKLSTAAGEADGKNPADESNRAKIVALIGENALAMIACQLVEGMSTRDVASLFDIPRMTAVDRIKKARRVLAANGFGELPSAPARTVRGAKRMPVQSGG